jgi:glycosyltransferase involved in cell wall biosynthesis|tara:strand:+ start:149 stop:844 length:696 start_codon:yes stop_codon:yes gene_type:complete
MLISIIIPVFNEEKTIKKILQKVNKLDVWSSNVQKEIIVINDSSSDGSEKILKENSNLYSKLVNNDKNRGKGFAIRKGLEISKGDYVLIQDADEEYDPNDYSKFIECADKFNADLVIGSRFIYDKYTRSHNFLNKVGNGVITLLFNIIYNTTFTDIYCCYIFFKKDLIKSDRLKSNGFEQHAEILCKLVKNGNKFFEVPVNYNGRTINEGKKIRFYHIFSIIYQMIKNRFI